MKTYELQIREKGTKNRSTIKMAAHSKLQAFNLAWAFFEGFNFGSPLNNFEKAFITIQPYMVEPLYLLSNLAGKYYVPFSSVKLVK